MAFVFAQFKPISHIGAIGTGPGSVRQLCSYITNDDAATVEATGYFNSLAKQLSVGDQILCSLDLDGTPQFKAYMVSAISAGVVTVVKLIVT